MCIRDSITSLNRKGEYYNRIAKALTAGHVDFDFGDEILLEQDGKVENGLFVAGKCSYQVVVIPGVSNLFANTVKLLKEFLAAGGTVIWLKMCIRDRIRTVLTESSQYASPVKCLN